MPPALTICDMAVSIHAPARGATRDRPALTQRFIVSIHAPARGATEYDALTEAFRKVSIHAPARGATLLVFPLFRSVPCFNPRAREGRDGTGGAGSLCSYRFQSTRPRGARRPLIPKEGSK